MEQRFWSKVNRRGTDECWEWLGGTNAGGYGRFCCSGTSYLSHRVAWELTHGKISDGLVVRHKCRGKCVNPAHLELGTQGDNNRDRTRDGTDNKGERHPKRKLTQEQVIQMRQKLAVASYGEGKQIAIEYGVHPTTVSHIKRCDYWKKYAEEIKV